jgi:hypothetical protein
MFAMSILRTLTADKVKKRENYFDNDEGQSQASIQSK